MSVRSSFRLRLLIGSVLWTMGLLALAHMIFRIVVFHYFRFITRDLIIIGLALLFALAGIVAVRSGLVPFRRLRARLLEVRDGHQQTVTGSYPSEVQPLVDDLNSLLEQRDRAVRRAQAKAGDLAHGLKTPLAILTQEAERAKREGHAELAVTIVSMCVSAQRIALLDIGRFCCPDGQSVNLLAGGNSLHYRQRFAHHESKLGIKTHRATVKRCLD